MAGYGAENQHESVSFFQAPFFQAPLCATKKLNVIAALLLGSWNTTVAKRIASIDHDTDERISVNAVSG
ncbi:hypothetical protein QTJ16_000355 [Diplocarpon rosae]|uniref:Uncharacterized protein n=1 Tax=Diplocarpon rosae TaxID=946125 RepID=A0AAD9WFK4_9HELO|nr:hypothetical protein QTJ16_000355 [Diplocarpon rosae]